MSARHGYALPFGAAVAPDGTTRFRIWAPMCASLGLELQNQGVRPMSAQAEGWFELSLPAPPGTRYRFVLPDGMNVPDPASRLQDGDVHGWSIVIDPTEHEWHHGDWQGRPWPQTVLYEVHVGLMGGFNGVRDRLSGWQAAGITAVELMPLNDFPGARNWGYDGVLPYAPDTAYGSPGELKALIDHAHGLGLMVFLDVVYNHFGPDGAYQHVYGGARFFTEDKHSPWGAGIDFDRPQVQQYFIQNAIYWLQEYRFDGLRFDAVSAYQNEPFADLMAREIRRAIGPERHVHLVAEHDGNLASHLAPGLFDAQWADDTHHALHVMLTDESEGYYADYTDASAKLARALSEGFAFQGEVSFKGEPRGETSAHLPPSAFVIFLQNHDQIGNRAMGERLIALADREALLAAYALLLLVPQIPLLYMGELEGSTAPFLFFTDHHDELAELVREGRRREFAHFAAFADEQRRDQIPDPNAEQTYAMSRPDEPADPEIRRHLTTLLALRHVHVVPRIAGARSLGAQPLGAKAVVAKWQMGDGSELIVAANLGAEPAHVDPLDGDMVFESHDGDAAALADGSLRRRSTVALILAAT
jgi:maltooligosyltrehalose trehalohydrolase